MDGKLYFTVTLVALAWLSVSTCRGDTNGTTVVDMTTSGTTTMMPNTTMSNTTMSNTTMSNTTAAPMTTVAPPLTPNNTVVPLEMTLNNSECGTNQLCAAEPADCNPSTSSCTFLGTKEKSGQNFEFSLAGETSGYIAAVVSNDATLGGDDTTYVCFKKNGNVAFTGAKLNNGVLTKQNVSANNVRGKLNGQQIQCVFDATVPANTARSTGVTLGVITGTYNGTDGSFGNASTIIRTPPVDLSNPNSTTTNLASANTTTSPNTTSSAMTFRQTLIPALMISAGVVGLSVL